MAKIICKVNIGLSKQTVYIESQKYSGKRTLERFNMLMEEIPKFIARQVDIKDVYLSGAPKSYLSQIEKDTKNFYSADDKVFHYV